MLRPVKRLVLLVPLALVVAALIPSPASADYWRHCGSQNHAGGGWYFVKAHGIHCGKARGVAHSYSRTGYSPGSFNCQRRTIGIEAARISCRRILGRRVQKVRFTVGA
jgi:hypothetical protein